MIILFPEKNGRIRGYWLNEDGTKTPTKPKYGLLKIHFKKLVKDLEAN